MVYIVCGSIYSVVIIVEGELYIWGCGNYGWLGYGFSEDEVILMLVVGFKGLKVIDVVCGSGDV